MRDQDAARLLSERIVGRAGIPGPALWAQTFFAHRRKTSEAER